MRTDIVASLIMAKLNKDKFKRTHSVCFLFNDLEMQVFDDFCKKYKINNRSGFIREAVMRKIFKKMDEDYPTLFDFDVD